MRQPRVLIVTSCTGEKRSKPENQLRLEDFKDSTQLQKREAELVEFACQAGQIYTGQQQHGIDSKQTSKSTRCPYPNILMHTI